MEKRDEKPDGPVLIENPEMASALKDAFAVVHHQGDDGSLFIMGAPDDPSNPRAWATWKRCKSRGFEGWTSRGKVSAGGGWLIANHITQMPSFSLHPV